MAVVVALVTSVVLIGFGAYSLYCSLRLVWRGYATSGTVVSVTSELNVGSGRNIYNYRPVIRFRTRRGQKKTWTGTTSTNRSFRVGQSVRMRYDPDSDKASLDSLLDLWVVPAFMVGAGLVIMVVMVQKAL
jgi:hypothetical protein